MKKMMILLMAFVLIFTGCSSNSTSQEVKPIDLKLSLTASEASIWMVAAEEFKRIVEEETEGRYTVSIFPSEQLAAGDSQKGVEMVVNGTTDLDIHSAIIWTGYDERLSVLSMPWIFQNGYDSVDELFFNGVGGTMTEEIIEAKGVKVLGFGENGFRQITNSVRPITSVADLEGLKIRTPSISLYIDLFKLLGADPTAMNFSEVFTSLQQGTIDGQENPLDVISSYKLSEVQDYLTIWNYSYDPLVITASGKLWDSLSDADKAIFEKAGKEAGALQVSKSREKDSTILEELKSSGMEVYELSEAEAQEFKDAAAPIYEMYREQITDEVLESFGYVFK